MPAHGATSAIDTAAKSDGTLVSPADWRANRLADAMAKRAALVDAAPVAAEAMLKDAVAAATYYAAFIGAATHAANNYKRVVTDADGSSRTVTCRDTVAKRPSRTTVHGSTVADRDAAVVHPSPCSTSAAKSTEPMPMCSEQHVPAGPLSRTPAVRRRRSAVAEAVADGIANAAFFAAWRAGLNLRPRDASMPSASERLEAIRTR
eukprot:12410837-Karenia_brevis.AAC.1